MDLTTPPVAAAVFLAVSTFFGLPSFLRMRIETTVAKLAGGEATSRPPRPQ